MNLDSTKVVEFTPMAWETQQEHQLPLWDSERRAGGTGAVVLEDWGSPENKVGRAVSLTRWVHPVKQWLGILFDSELYL